MKQHHPSKSTHAHLLTTANHRQPSLSTPSLQEAHHHHIHSKKRPYPQDTASDDFEFAPSPPIGCLPSKNLQNADEPVSLTSSELQFESLDANNSIHGVNMVNVIPSTVALAIATAKGTSSSPFFDSKLFPQTLPTSRSKRHQRRKQKPSRSIHQFHAKPFTSTILPQCDTKNEQDNQLFDSPASVSSHNDSDTIALQHKVLQQRSSTTSASSDFPSLVLNSSELPYNQSATSINRSIFSSNGSTTHSMPVPVVIDLTTDEGSRAPQQQGEEDIPMVPLLIPANDQHQQQPTAFLHTNDHASAFPHAAVHPSSSKQQTLQNASPVDDIVDSKPTPPLSAQETSPQVQAIIPTISSADRLALNLSKTLLNLRQHLVPYAPLSQTRLRRPSQANHHIQHPLLQQPHLQSNTCTSPPFTAALPDTVSTQQPNLTNEHYHHQQQQQQQPSTSVINQPQHITFSPLINGTNNDIQTHLLLDKVSHDPARVSTLSFLPSQALPSSNEQHSNPHPGEAQHAASLAAHHNHISHPTTRIVMFMPAPQPPPRPQPFPGLAQCFEPPNNFLPNKALIRRPQPAVVIKVNDTSHSIIVDRFDPFYASFFSPQTGHRYINTFDRPVKSSFFPARTVITYANDYGAIYAVKPMTQLGLLRQQQHNSSQTTSQKHSNRSDGETEESSNDDYDDHDTTDTHDNDDDDDDDCFSPDNSQTCNKKFDFSEQTDNIPPHDSQPQSDPNSTIVNQPTHHTHVRLPSHVRPANTIDCWSAAGNYNLGTEAALIAHFHSQFPPNYVHSVVFTSCQPFFTFVCKHFCKTPRFMQLITEYNPAGYHWGFLTYLASQPTDRHRFAAEYAFWKARLHKLARSSFYSAKYAQNKEQSE